MKKKIFATHSFFSKVLEKKREEFDVVIYDGKDISREKLLEGVKGAVAIVCLLTEKIDKEVMEVAGDQLKIISNYAVGYDNIDIHEATKRGICVTNTPGVLTESVAEHIIALILSIYRRVVEGDRMIRDGKFKGWEPDLLLGTSLKDKTLGVVGLGRIGRWTVRLARALGMKVIYFNRLRNLEFEEEMKCTFHSLDALLSMADVVSISLSLSEETKHMFDYKKFLLMKKNAILINTARGPIVNEHDLVRILKERKIAGAGMDVFEDEGHIPKELLKMSNVVLTPHIASATLEARESMAKVLVENLEASLSGRSPSCLVNKEVLSYE